MRGAPQRGIRRGHAPDQSPERGVDGRATSGRAAREKRPVRAKATPLPPQDSVRSHDDEGLLPPGPDAGQPDPEEAITSAERWPGHRSFVHSELLTRPDSRGPAGGGRPRGRGEAEANGVRTALSFLEYRRRHSIIAKRFVLQLLLYGGVLGLVVACSSVERADPVEGYMWLRLAEITGRARGACAIGYPCREWAIKDEPGYRRELDRN